MQCDREEEEERNSHVDTTEGIWDFSFERKECDGGEVAGKVLGPSLGEASGNEAVVTPCMRRCGPKTLGEQVLKASKIIGS